MDALKAKRKGFKISFTTCVNKIDELLLKETPDLKELLILKNQLQNKFERLTACQEEISNKILQIENSDELFSEDFVAAEEYRDKFHAVSAILGSMLYNSSLPKEVERRNFKLPEIELKKFNGDPKEFLAFWSQFEKIHLDESLPDEDKFQYLLQSVIPKSKAARLLESFPATAANYSKAVSQLRERFGREDLLVQIYVRELLTMVMKNAVSGRAKVELPILYELEGKLRALDSLGRTQEKYGDFLTPLVESCLPEDILVAWERSRNKGTDSATSDDRTLENLMDFLKQEVMGEEMVVLARTGFGANHHKKSKDDFNERAYEISSAAALVSTNTPENPGKRHYRSVVENRHGANNCASTKSEETLVECPDNKAGINCDKSIEMETINDLSSIETVSPRNPQVPLSVGNDKNSSKLLVMPTDISFSHQTNLPNRTSTVDDRSSSLQNTGDTLDSVRNTHKSNNGSRSDLPEINGCSENNSNATLLDATKNSSPELGDSTPSRATVSSPERKSSVCPAYKDTKLCGVSVIPEPSSHLSTPDPDVKIKSEPDNNDPSVSSPTPTEHSTHLNSPSTSTGVNATHRNAETPSVHSAWEYKDTKLCGLFVVPKPSSHLSTPDPDVKIKSEPDDNDPSVSSPAPTEQALERSTHLNSPSTSTGVNATHRNAETPGVHSAWEAGKAESFNGQRSCGEENAISARLLARNNAYRSENDESGLSKRRCLSTRSHFITRDKSYLVQEIRSLLERLDEAKLDYENKCRTILKDYRTLLSKLSDESDPTFLMSEYASSWNSLKLFKLFYNEGDL